MPIVRLSGRVGDEHDPNRKTRAKLLYRLFGAGWDIYNGNGDQRVTLNNIQKKIVESDAFVFTQGATLSDMFQAVSIFVGYQTNDRDLLCKPSVLQNGDGSWNGLLALIEHLHHCGTVRQKITDYFDIVEKPKEVLAVLKEKASSCTKEPQPEPDIFEEAHGVSLHSDKAVPDFNVCVFCSASIKEQAYLDAGFLLGKSLAEQGWGCVSGAGKTGIMGKVVEGNAAAGGWSGGSNVPHIIAMEGLPDGLDEFWPRGDIYTRMEAMIERSQAFIIMPGGTGTVQEMFALALLKQQGHALVQGKPIVIVIWKLDSGDGFWDPLIAMLESSDVEDLYHVVDTPEDAIAWLKK